MNLKECELLRLSDWLQIYRRICDEFGFSIEEDEKAAKRLADMIGAKGATELARLREGFPNSVLICGGGPSLADELSSIGTDRYVVAADSAASVLLDADLGVSMIVTDLDGIVEDQIELNKRGATVFVHAHGDNQRAVERYVPLFAGPIVGTCQCAPPEGIVNLGGFTDGDRAACICAGLGSEKLYLAGFDFENPAEKPGKDLQVKKRKLVWAKKIMSMLAEQGVKILDASTERGMF